MSRKEIIAAICKERERQSEKWGDDHDDSHGDGRLAYISAAMCLEKDDIWGLHLKHGHDRKRELVIAAALIVSEIERLERAEVGDDDE